MIFRQIIRFVIQRSPIIIFLLLTILAGSLWQIGQHLKVDNDLSIWFLEDNTDYQEYLSFQEEQGSDEVIIAMIPAKDVFAPSHLEKLQGLHDQTADLASVGSSFSLANAQYPIYSNQKLYFRNIYSVDRDRDHIVRLLEELPALRRQLITEDQRFSFFYLQLIPSDQLAANRKQTIQELQSLIHASFPEAQLTGAPILNEAFNQSIYEESIFFGVVSVVVIFILLLFLLPHWHYLPIAFVAIVIPVTLTLGLMVSLGYALNLISMLLPTILMIYCVSDLIHIVNIFHLHRKKHPEQNKLEQIQRALRTSLQPCFYTTLTTVIGYLTLTLSPMPALRDMGLFSFIGLTLAFGLVYLIAAIGFSFLNHQSLAAEVRKINISAITKKISYWTTHYNSTVIGTGLVIFLLGTLSLYSIEVSTDSLHLLSQGKVKKDLQAIETQLGGSTRLQLNIFSHQETALLKKDVLNKLKTFQEKLAQNSLLSHPISLVNFQTFLENRLSVLSRMSSLNLEKALSANPQLSNTFFSLFGEDLSYLAININIKELDTKNLNQLLSSIQTDFASSFPPEEYGLKIHGFSALYAQLNTFILQTQFWSFGAAFAISFFILFYFIGHFKTSLLVLIPNLLPLFAAMMVLALFDIPLEVGNAMLAPIMLGVAMDDTIHLIHRFKVYQRAGSDITTSIDQALDYTGGALFATTLSLVCGFLIVGLSSIPSVSTFGLLCAFTILLALLTDVCLLPALLKRFGGR